MEELSSIQQGFFLLKEHNFSAAALRFSDALGEKEESSAYIGLLLARSQMQGEEQLPELPKPLSEYEEYRKALELAGEGYGSTLRAYEEAQKKVLDGKEEKYKQLRCDLAAAEKEEKASPAKEIETLDALISRAKELDGYKDAPAIIEVLNKRKSELLDKGKKQRNKKLKIILPIAICAAIALIIAGFFFLLPVRGDVRYALTLNGYVAISCDEDATAVTLEETIFGIPVTGVGKKAFKDCEDLEVIKLNANVKKIERAAFNGCKSLQFVIDAKNVETVEENAFKECKRLRELHFSENCMIDPYAFRACDKALKVYVGDKIWERPKGAPDDDLP